MLFQEFYRFAGRLYSTSAGTTSFNSKKWDINVSLTLFRMPLITSSPTDIEKKFMNISATIEHEQSYKSDFELKTEKDLM